MNPTRKGLGFGGFSGSGLSGTLKASLIHGAGSSSASDQDDLQSEARKVCCLGAEFSSRVE